MNLPWWVFRIWAKENSGTPLPTFGNGPGVGRHESEAEKLESLIIDTIDVLPGEGTRREAERIVAYAWALYVFAEPPVYCLDRTKGKVTKFPLSSFIEVSQGYIFAAFDGIQRAERSGDPAAKAFREAMG